MVDFHLHKALCIRHVFSSLTVSTWHCLIKIHTQLLKLNAISVFFVCVLNVLVSYFEVMQQ
jgi:site-specific recombinase